jgi:hypothetical protein
MPRLSDMVIIWNDIGFVVFFLPLRTQPSFTPKKSTMKDLSYFILCLVLLPIISFAQVGKQDRPPPFIYLRNGTLLKEGEFETKGGFFGKRFRYNNGDKISFNDIKFYQGEDGYFANYYGRFAACTETGTFDLFTLIEENSYYDGNTQVQTSSKRYL